MDKETIVAGMLHDAVEDTAMTLDDITRGFGEEVALLVDGVTKLGQLSYSQDKLEVQAENLRKMFLAMAKDIRVIIIKLADWTFTRPSPGGSVYRRSRRSSTTSLLSTGSRMSTISW